MNKIIVLDSETTGLDSINDEIVQLSIINFEGDVLFDEYIKPSYKKKWPQAQVIHGITPAMVKDKKTFRHYRKKIQRIIDEADMIIGYNPYFDLSFLANKGIEIKVDDVVDVMKIFAGIYGEWSEYFEDFKFQKLTTCANYYGYTWKKDTPNSLTDCKATLYCFKKMQDAI